MRRFCFIAFLLALFLGGSAAHATVEIAIDLSHQSMNVTGEAGSYAWPISSGRAGWPTPTGVYRPQSMHRMAYSRLFGNAPMPHAIFYSGNFAIHGTYATGALGHPASHGCIRLAPGNAATLFQMVKAEGARITISGAPPAPLVASGASRAKQYAGGARAKGSKYAHRTHGKGSKYASAGRSKRHVAGRAAPAAAQPQPPAQDFFGLFSGG